MLNLIYIIGFYCIFNVSIKRHEPNPSLTANCSVNLPLFLHCEITHYCGVYSGRNPMFFTPQKWGVYYTNWYRSGITTSTIEYLADECVK
jgi:hypothetical protein